MWLYLTPRITFQQEDEDTSGTCDWKYHNLCVWGDTLAHNYSDSRSVLHRLWERMILALWCSQGICDKPLQNHRCANLCSWYHWKSALYDAHTHVREHACLHVDTDTCVCVLLFVCVMNWCTLEKMKYHSYPLSQHEPNDNKHFKRRKCLSLLKCFCSSFTTRCRSNTALFRPLWQTPAVWCFCLIQIYILLWHWYNHWRVWTMCYRCFILQNFGICVCRIHALLDKSLE